MHRYISIVILLITTVGCCAHRPTVREVPLAHQVVERVEMVSLPGDSSTLRIVVGGLSAKSVDYKQGTSTLAPSMKWRSAGDTLTLTASTSRQEIPTVVRETLEEKPVMVEVPVEVNRLMAWQKILMWAGGVAIAYVAIRMIIKLK